MSHHPSALSACLAGDTAAFRQIVLQHQNLVTGICYAALGNRLAAEEAAQEAFIIAWRQLPSLRAPDRLRPWLAGIARNVCANARRARRRGPVAAGDDPDTTADPAAGPDATAIAREEEALVDHALANLPDEYREVLVLFYREEQSTGAVAGALELSDEAVRQRLVRGRRLLQERVLARVEHTLQRTSPGAAFAMAVMALLPAPSAPAAMAAGTAFPLATGTMLGATGASLGAQLGWLGAAIGFGCGLFGGWFGTRRAFAQARAPGQRRILVSFAWSIGLLALAGMAGLFACASRFDRLAALHPWLPWITLGLFGAGYVAALLGLIIAANRRFAQAGQGA